MALSLICKGERKLTVVEGLGHCLPKESSNPKYHPHTKHNFEPYKFLKMQTRRTIAVGEKSSNLIPNVDFWRRQDLLGKALDRGFLGIELQKDSL
jgi:hypothetical protein